VLVTTDSSYCICFLLILSDKSTGVWFCLFVCLFCWFFFFFGLFFLPCRGWLPAAYGGSQARGLIGAVAAGLCQSHSNSGSELHL